MVNDTRKITKFLPLFIRGTQKILFSNKIWITGDERCRVAERNQREGLEDCGRKIILSKLQEQSHGSCPSHHKGGTILGGCLGL